MTRADRIFIVASMAIFLTTFIGAANYQPVPVINVELPSPARIEVVEPAPVDPDVDEDEFVEACQAVCSSPGIGSIRVDGSLDPAPRMLYANFERMVCACFDGDRVHRYVEWEKQ